LIVPPTRGKKEDSPRSLIYTAPTETCESDSRRSKRNSRYGRPPSRHRLAFIVVDKGPGSAASLHSAGSRGGMFHSFCLPSHLPRACLHSLVLRRQRRLEPPQQIARIRVFPMRRQRECPPWEALRCSRLCLSVQAETRRRAREKEAYYGLTNLQPHARRDERSCSRHYFMVSYVHTSHTTDDKRASRPGDMARMSPWQIASRLRWSVA